MRKLLPILTVLCALLLAGCPNVESDENEVDPSIVGTWEMPEGGWIWAWQIDNSGVRQVAKIVENGSGWHLERRQWVKLGYSAHKGTLILRLPRTNDCDGGGFSAVALGELPDDKDLALQAFGWLQIVYGSALLVDMNPEYATETWSYAVFNDVISLQRIAVGPTPVDAEPIIAYKVNDNFDYSHPAYDLCDFPALDAIYGEGEIEERSARP